MTQVAPPARPAPAAPAGDWTPIAPTDLPAWNDRLLATRASLFQYPYWNEPLRVLHFAPQYLQYVPHGASRAPAAYACVLRLGPPGARIGLVQRGPVPLDDGGDAAGAVHALARWARARGYAFLRCTHDDAAVLDDAAAMRGARRLDAFPFYREPQEALIVPQDDDDDVVLRGFQPIARRNLRRAASVGFRLSSSDDPDALAAVWPLFRGLAHRKHLRFRPEASFRALVALARPHDGARVHVAHLGDRPVQALLVVRDHDHAHYIAGALDTDALGDTPSPAVLLHWTAMREAWRCWAAHYDLGTRSGGVHPFKRKFRPLEEHHPPAVTLVGNPLLFRLWLGAGLPLITRQWPRIKSALAGTRGSAPVQPEPPAEGDDP